MRERGIIKTYLSEKGFGFIGRNGAADLFFHISALEPGAAETVRKARLSSSLSPPAGAGDPKRPA
jgi:cold shock CspA family protein